MSTWGEFGEWTADNAEKLSARAHERAAQHEHLYREGSPSGCPDRDCWWNDPDIHEGPGKFTPLTVEPAFITIWHARTPEAGS